MKISIEHPNAHTQKAKQESYIDLNQKLLKPTYLTHWHLKHPCENGVSIKHVCEQLTSQGVRFK
ncbi:hypothetical protein YTPLAS21_19450 [Candidatus Nitrosocosmicus sp.]|nr:hypothetical protein YTPLAS21_19450 [Candidatus Nitrosocosmicus sp.]